MLRPVLHVTPNRFFRISGLKGNPFSLIFFTSQTPFFVMSYSPVITWQGEPREKQQILYPMNRLFGTDKERGREDCSANLL